MLLGLKKEIIYGPVQSRRLGRSLGLNILPGDRKACPFNCVYCQYGWTGYHTLRIPRSSVLRRVEEVKVALETALNKLETPPVFITFSGNGEPTSHPDFDAMVDAVNSVRDRLIPTAKTAILSNSSLVGDASIRKSLSKLDWKIMKLDCGSLEVFRNYNQPCRGVDLERITRGLEKLGGVTIQALFTSGENGNLEARSVEEWIERLKKIKPIAVQLYTLDRDYPDRTLKYATLEELSAVKRMAVEEGLPAEVYQRH